MQILFANKVVNAGVIEIPFLWGIDHSKHILW